MNTESKFLVMLHLSLSDHVSLYRQSSSDGETSQDKSMSFTITSEQDFPTLGDQQPSSQQTKIVKPESPPRILIRSQVFRARKKKKGGHQKAV